jgi:hypothetical protein
MTDVEQREVRPQCVIATRQRSEQECVGAQLPSRGDRIAAGAELALDRHGRHELEPRHAGEGCGQ